MTDTFVQELPLRVTAKEEKQLNASFEAARQVYNACLGEFLKRRDLMRQSKLYQAALAMSKGKRGKDATEQQKRQAKERTKAFREVEQAIGFTEYAAYAYTKRFTRSWLANHLDSQVNRKLAKRAFSAVERFHYGTDKPCRKGKCPYKKKKCPVCTRPRFKRKGGVNSVVGTSNVQSIRWVDGAVVWNASKGRRLELEAIVDREDPFIAHALSHRVKYVRLIRKQLNGRLRFYAQLSLEGKPLQRIELGKGDVGLDLGPSTIAIVSETRALLLQFCAELEDKRAETRRLQRKIDHQRRANNPDNYGPDGQVKKGPKKWVQSKRQKRTEVKLAEVRRKEAAYRKSLHGELVNLIWQLGDTVKTEKLSYKAFQKMWGKSVGTRAPGTFMELLRRRGDAIGGRLEEFSTYSTRCSQTCHDCGTKKKKSLNERWHNCDCGIIAQRDLYSAFLAMCVEGDTINADLTRERWSSVGSLLQAALIDAEVAMERGAAPSSFGLHQRQSHLPVETKKKDGDAMDVVPVKGRAMESLPDT